MTIQDIHVEPHVTVSLSYKIEEKKDDSYYTIIQRVRKNKKFGGGHFLERGWWVKVWESGSDVFLGQHLKFSHPKPELVNQCNPFVLLFETFVCIECCEARNH